MSACTDKENIGMPNQSPLITPAPSHKTTKKPGGVGPRSGSTKSSSSSSSCLGVASGHGRRSAKRPSDQPRPVGVSTPAVAREPCRRSTTVTAVASAVTPSATQSRLQRVSHSGRSKLEPDASASSSPAPRAEALSRRLSGQGGGASAMEKIRRISKDKTVSAASPPPPPSPALPVVASVKPNVRKRGSASDALVEGAGRSKLKEQTMSTKNRKGKRNLKKLASPTATFKAPLAPPPRLSMVEGQSAFDFDLQEEEDGDSDDGVWIAARVDDAKVTTHTAHSDEGEHRALINLNAVDASQGAAVPRRRCSTGSTRRLNGSGGSKRAAATSASDGKRSTKKARAGGGRGRKGGSTKKRGWLSDELRTLARGAPEVAAAAASNRPSSFFSPASSSGTQEEDSTGFSPLGSWHLGALFGESEDEEGAAGVQHRDAVPTWRLSDSDDDADMVDDGAERGGGSTRRRASGSSIRGGGVGGGGRWSSTDVSTSDSSKEPRRGVSKPASGFGTTAPGRKHGGVVAAGSSDMGDGDAAAEEEASSVQAVVSLTTKTLDTAGVAGKASAPSAASKRESREQQAEMEALQALRALYNKVDSHELKFSR